MTSQPAQAPVQLFHTATGERLHIPPCPHVHGVQLFPAYPTTTGSRQVCTWCQAEIDGVGRTYYDSLDDAMRAFGSFAETRDRIRRETANVPHDAIWIPNSRSYIALGEGGPAVCWIGKTYVMHVRGDFVELPGYVAGAGGGTETALREGNVCPTCFTVMPITGRCDSCG